MDPRGSKLGGIETHVRHMAARHPADMRLLFVGVDEIGDCPLGQVTPITLHGRTIDFLPVVRIASDDLNRAARQIFQSATFQFAAGMLRHILAIRSAIGTGPASVELQRFEFALIARALGLPAVQVVHGEGSKADKMDSLIKRYWFVHAMNEQLALSLARKIICVNPTIVTRIGREWPHLVNKAEMMTVSVDQQTFPARPFATEDDVFRIVFAGRLDEFKDPPLMFSVMARLHAALGGRFEFHYVGTSDPNRYAEFAAIEPFTVRHGFQTAAGVAEIMARCHAGVLTSFFEGMPCYLLELLSTGRPCGAIRLPQFDPLIREGVSGAMIERRATPEQSADALTDVFLRLWTDIRRGALDPSTIHGLTAPYRVDVQMARLFDHHRALGRSGHQPASAITLSNTAR
jgi:glycosyltransferase involved in cell wall biosynthesis